MKVLVFGAGVIGITYAWQLSEAGYDVSLFVKKQRMVRFSHSGISINCTDLRGNEKEFVKTVYRPKTIDRMAPEESYDLVIVCLKNQQLKEAVPYIAKQSGNAHILFFGNMWDEFDMIDKHLSSQRCLFGFPAMVGGGRTDNDINCVLFKNSHTFLGTSNSISNSTLLNLADVLGKSGMQPRISSNIKDLIKINYILSAATFGAICKAGNVKVFASNYAIIRQSVMAIREGYAVARKKQVKTWKVFSSLLFYLPLFLGASLLKRSYNAEMIKAVEGTIKNSFDEKKKHYYDILNEGKSSAISMHVWQSFEPYILKVEKKQQLF